MEKKQSRFNLDISIVDLLVIAAGTAIYSFGIVFLTFIITWPMVALRVLR